LKRYLIRIENINNYTPQQISRVKEILKGVSDKFANIRISKFAIEFDYFSEGDDKAIRDKLNQSLGRILDFRELKSAFNEESSDLAFQLYTQERFWEAHEVLEGLWRKERDEKRKELIQSLILLCASYVHMQKGRNSVSLGILERAADKMNANFEESKSLRIDFQNLRKKIVEVIEEGNPRIIDITPFKMHNANV